MCIGMIAWQMEPETNPYPLRTHMLRLLGPKTLSYKVFGVRVIIQSPVVDGSSFQLGSLLGSCL